MPDIEGKNVGACDESSGATVELAVFNDPGLHSTLATYRGVLAYVWTWPLAPCVDAMSGKTMGTTAPCELIQVVNADTGEWLVGYRVMPS
jgi:hypothetical protein